MIYSSQKMESDGNLVPGTPLPCSLAGDCMSPVCSGPNRSTIDSQATVAQQNRSCVQVSDKTMLINGKTHPAACSISTTESPVCSRPKRQDVLWNMEGPWRGGVENIIE